MNESIRTQKEFVKELSDYFSGLYGTKRCFDSESGFVFQKNLIRNYLFIGENNIRSQITSFCKSRNLESRFKDNNFNVKISDKNYNIIIHVDEKYAGDISVMLMPDITADLRDVIIN